MGGEEDLWIKLKAAKSGSGFSAAWACQVASSPVFCLLKKKVKKFTTRLKLGKGLVKKEAALPPKKTADFATPTVPKCLQSNKKYCIIFLIRHMPLFKEQKWIYSKNVMNLTKLKS
ncbi:MAG: hypothetical protein IKB21_01710 [Clostridia bacterium]|nr:hypothetical protein [Clostridia bacterium]MBR2433306.1 hypothetical protein [Clostridia bacterium]